MAAERVVALQLAAVKPSVHSGRRRDGTGVGMRYGWTVLRPLAAIVAGLLSGIILVGVAHAQFGDDSAMLNAKAIKLYQAGKYAEATEIFKRLLAFYETAPEHPNMGTLLNNLAELYRVQGRYTDARAAL